MLRIFVEIQVDCYGEATHGSTFSETNITATGKVRAIFISVFTMFIAICVILFRKY